MTTPTTSTSSVTNTTSTVSQQSLTVTQTLTSQTPLTTAIAGTENRVSTNNHDISQPQNEVPSTIPTQNNQPNPTQQPPTTSASSIKNADLTCWIIRFCVVPNNKPSFSTISTTIEIPQTSSYHINSSDDNSEFRLGMILPVHQEAMVGGQNSADNLGYFGQAVNDNYFEPQPGPSGLHTIKRPHADIDAEEDIEQPTKYSRNHYDDFDTLYFNPADQLDLESWDMSGYNYDEILEEAQYYKDLYFDFIKD